MKHTTDKIFLTADTVNGVQEGNDESVLTEGGLMDEEYFFDSLHTCSDDECIGAYVSIDTYKKIKAKYGIGGYVTTIIDEDEDED
jgi:hypothetical protein